MSDLAIVTCVVSWALAFCLVAFLAWDSYKRKLAVDRERIDHIAQFQKQFDSVATTLRDSHAALDKRLVHLEGKSLGAAFGSRRGIPVE